MPIFIKSIFLFIKKYWLSYTYIAAHLNVFYNNEPQATFPH